MLLWTLCVAFGIAGMASLKPTVFQLVDFWSLSRPRGELSNLLNQLLTLQETLEAGWVPQPLAWKALAEAAPPWGPQSAALLESLRARGASVVPAIARLREAVRSELEYLHEARVGSSQALAQALVCGGVGPMLGGVLYLTLDTLERVGGVWWSLVAAAAVVGIAAARWIVAMADRARRAGRSAHEEGLRVQAVLALEKMIALIRSGLPPDLAWSQALACPGSAPLAELWGGAFWTGGGASRSVLEECGQAVRRAIQVSTMQGQSCLERLEALQREAATEARAAVKRELALLPGRALRPLFVLVLPSVLALLMVAFLLEGFESGFI